MIWREFDCPMSISGARSSSSRLICAALASKAWRGFRMSYLKVSWICPAPCSQTTRALTEHIFAGPPHFPGRNSTECPVSIMRSFAKRLFSIACSVLAAFHSSKPGSRRQLACAILNATVVYGHIARFFWVPWRRAGCAFSDAVYCQAGLHYGTGRGMSVRPRAPLLSDSGARCRGLRGFARATSAGA